MAVSKLLSLCQDVEAVFSPIDGQNESVSKEQVRPVFADVLCLRRSHVEERKRDACRLLGVFLPGLFHSFADRSSCSKRRDGQNMPTASLLGRSLMQTMFSDVFLARAGPDRPNLAGMFKTGTLCQMEATVLLSSTFKYRTVRTRHGEKEPCL